MYAPYKISEKSAPSANSIPRGRVAIVDNRPSQLRQIQLMEEIRSSATAAGSASGVVQRALTRTQVDKIVIDIFNGTFTPADLEEYDQAYQYLILSRARDCGIDVSSFNAFLASGDQEAESDSDIDHPEMSDTEEYGPGTPPYDTAQLKRNPGPSGPKDVLPSMRKVTYIRDAAGNINFGIRPTVDQFGSWSTPVHTDPQVDLCEDTHTTDRGRLPNGNIVYISGASRPQHFAIANRIAAKYGRTHGDGGNSPHGWTWHHLLTKYKMHLVDRTVHQKFGHNGGFYFW